MTHRHRFAILSIAWLMLSAQAGFGQIRQLVLDDSLTLSTVEAINTNEFAIADRIIDAQLAQDSTSLKWLFLKGMRFYPEIFVLPSVNRPALDRFKEYMQKVTELGEDRLDDEPEDPNALFFAGGAYGYLGLALFADKSVFGGIGSAKTGYKMQQSLIESCPECYDAYLGPGMMNLLTSQIPAFLKPIMWLFGLSGTEETAYEYLTLAYTKGALVHLEAGTYLAQLYERRKDYKKSAEIYTQLTQKYPMKVALRAESFTPFWADKRYSDISASAIDMITSFKQGRYKFSASDSAWMPSVLSSFSSASKLQGDTVSAITVLEEFIGDGRFGSISQWRIRLTLAESYAQQRDSVAVLQHYEAILNSNAPDDTKDRVRKAMEKWRTVR